MAIYRYNPEKAAQIRIWPPNSRLVPVRHNGVTSYNAVGPYDPRFPWTWTERLRRTWRRIRGKSVNLFGEPPIPPESPPDKNEMFAASLRKLASELSTLSQKTESR